MFAPDDPLKPRDPVFDEAWQAQVLALADTMVKAGHFTARAWAETLGAHLAQASATGQPDTPQTYYLAALSALEELSGEIAGLRANHLKKRKEEWARAYRRTPHGQPVLLAAGQD